MTRPQQLLTIVALCGAASLAASNMPTLSFGPFAVENAVTPARGWDPPTGAISLNPDVGRINIPLPTVIGSLNKTVPSEPDTGTIKVPLPSAVGPLTEVTISEPDAKPVDMPSPTVVARLGEAATPDPDLTGTSVASVSANETVVEAPLLLAPRPDRAPETTEKLASLVPADTAKEPSTPAERPLLTIDECAAIDTCVDEYLWSLYERTPKVDTNKVTEKVKKTVKKKGKLRTVMTSITKYVLGDFTWKDPAAAERTKMSTKDYVIGGMARGFKLKLYRALHTLEDAGFMPGITSGFRDDYRQEIATGNKASSDSSYHGGSRRGGFGKGLAADIVSVKGETRMERYAASDEMWKWIDAHEKELAIGRPYQDRDPPHVGPLDGKEYADKRGIRDAQKKAAVKTKKAQTAKVEAKKHGRAHHNEPDTAKRPTPEKSASKVSSLQSKVAVQR
jgi:hypothetical protein